VPESVTPLKTLSASELPKRKTDQLVSIKKLRKLSKGIELKFEASYFVRRTAPSASPIVNIAPPIINAFRETLVDDFVHGVEISTINFDQIYSEQFKVWGLR
jgi:hypothetical protein